MTAFIPEVPVPTSPAGEQPIGRLARDDIDSKGARAPTISETRSAIRQAAHAVIRLYLEIGKIRQISMAPPGGSIVWEHDEPRDHTEEYLLAMLSVTLSGRAAEEAIIGNVAAEIGVPASDLRIATEMAIRLETTSGFAQKWRLLHRPIKDPALIFAVDPSFAGLVHNRLEAAYGAAKTLVARQRGAIEALAGALLTHRTLEGKLLEQTLDRVRERIQE
ncbi:cell division protease FtsH [Aminobacter niigataensis]|uniref:Cell division protease FtsH n=1 Tax=Aminobacter niigataensis TaxID=83265 RepID=A0ABR6L1B9_9HYPH|nr:hypothetical protein [Aminobacter niigataensis]MBB4650574.1 cell division protease FtsH [Aminobacter niigataensis]